jgi:hypothetical protein
MFRAGWTTSHACDVIRAVSYQFTDVPPKRRLSSPRLDGVTSQKIVPTVYS